MDTKEGVVSPKGKRYGFWTVNVLKKVPITMVAAAKMIKMDGFIFLKGKDRT
ncbi:MAG: hypothetical protein L5655_09445 [Thermosediminibacteraceae bacterium]|nr:hypothetical protein [Thermosediminibacteraceae bacterium]